MTQHCPTLKSMLRQGRELRKSVESGDPLDTLETLGEDFTPETQPQVKHEEPPATAKDAGDQLGISSTAVKNRILAISANVNIPKAHLAEWSGSRIGRLTPLGWKLVQEIPGNKHDRPAWYDRIDSEYSHLIQRIEIEPVEAEIVDEDLSSEDFQAIVLRRQSALSAPQEDDALPPMNLTGGLSDIFMLGDLSFAQGRALGRQIGQRMAAGLAQGIQEEQSRIRSSLLGEITNG